MDRRPGRLFLDRSELPSSSDLSAAIAAALGESRNLLLVCSPSAAASRWVNEEVRRFRALRGRDRIFCLIVDGDPALRDGPGGCFPPALLEPEPGDAGPVEPLAADTRPGQDGRRDAQLKLIAGLLDLEFDALRQRDQARRMRRLAAAAAGFAIVAAGLLALSIVAVLARNEARRQAETAMRTTDFLRSLFLGADPAEARGHDPTVRELVDRGVAGITASRDLQGQPRVQADLMTTLAEVYSTLGQYRAADTLVRRAARVDRSTPGVAMRQDALRAEIASADGRFDEARGLIARALAAAGPAPTPERSLLLIDRAFAERGAGNATAADATLFQARDESLRQNPPDREGADRALKEIASSAYQGGRYRMAQRAFALLLRSRRRLGEGDDPVVAAAYNELGAISYKLGDDRAARRWFEQALASETRLLGSEHPKVATIRGNLARTLVEQRRFAPALAMLAAARRTVLREQGATAAVLAWQDDSLGLARLGMGDAVGAEQAWRRGVAIARAARVSKEADLLVNLAALLCATERQSQALPLLARAEAVYADATATPAWAIARMRLVRGRCLTRNGDAAAGHALIRESAPALLARWSPDTLFGAEAAAAVAEAR